MPSKHKGHPTIAFRPSSWEKALIEQKAALSGMYKKDFITKSCIYSNIVVVGTKENVQRIVDALQEMQDVMKDVAGQMLSGDFSLSEGSFQQMKEEYLALAIAVVDIVNGAAYLFEKEVPKMENQWKETNEVGQLREVLKIKGERSVLINLLKRWS